MTAYAPTELENSYRSQLLQSCCSAGAKSESSGLIRIEEVASIQSMRLHVITFRCSKCLDPILSSITIVAFKSILSELEKNCEAV